MGELSAEAAGWIGASGFPCAGMGQGGIQREGGNLRRRSDCWSRGAGQCQENAGSGLPGCLHKPSYTNQTYLRGMVLISFPLPDIRHGNEAKT